MCMQCAQQQAGADIQELGNKWFKLKQWCTHSALSVTQLMRSRPNVQWLNWFEHFVFTGKMSVFTCMTLFRPWLHFDWLSNKSCQLNLICITIALMHTASTSLWFPLSQDLLSVVCSSWCHPPYQPSQFLADHRVYLLYKFTTKYLKSKLLEQSMWL